MHPQEKLTHQENLAGLSPRSAEVTPLPSSTIHTPTLAETPGQRPVCPARFALSVAAVIYRP